MLMHNNSPVTSVIQSKTIPSLFKYVPMSHKQTMGHGHSSPGPPPSNALSFNTTGAATNATNIVFGQTTAILMEVSVSGNAMCGITNDNFYCAPRVVDNSSTFQWVQHEGKFNHISLDSFNGTARVCGANNDQNVYCADNAMDPKWNQIPSPPNGIAQVSISGNTVCGVDKDSNILCSFYGLSNWDQKNGSLSQISLSGQRACGSTGAGQVLCTDSINYPTWKPENITLTQVSLSNDKLCGTNANLELYCADYGQGNWAKVGSGFKYISVDTSSNGTISMLALDKDNHVGNYTAPITK